MLFIDAGGKLIAAINQSKSGTERELERAALRLRQCKLINVFLESNPPLIFRLCAILDETENGIVPALDLRHGAYEIIERYNLLVGGALLLQRWNEIESRGGEPPLPDVQIKLAAFLRHSGRPEDALEVTRVLDPRSHFYPSQKQRSILCTERAAILLDLFEAKGDRAFLVEARQYASRAWAISCSEEVSRVFQRLKSLEKL